MSLMVPMTLGPGVASAAGAAVSALGLAQETVKQSTSATGKSKKYFRMVKSFLFHRILHPSVLFRGREILKFLSELADEFDVAPVLKVQLKMLGVQAELPKRSANLTGRGVVRRWPGPALVSAFVLKL